MIFNREPVAILAAVRAAVLAVMGFGVIHVSPSQLAGVMLALEAVLALVTRSKVTPVDGGGGDHGQSLLWTIVGILAVVALLIWIIDALNTGPIH